MKIGACILSAMTAVGLLLVSSQSAKADYGACVLKGSSVTAPHNYDSPDVGPGYVMKKMGSNSSMDSLDAMCTASVFQGMMGQFCQRSKGPVEGHALLVTYSRESKNLLHARSKPYMAPLGCDSSHGLHAACVIHNGSLGADFRYSASETGSNWVMKKKGALTTTFPEQMRNKCSSYDFQGMYKQYCRKNLDPMYWDLVVFDSDTHYQKHTMPVSEQCKPDLSISDVQPDAAQLSQFAVGKNPKGLAKVTVKNVGTRNAPQSEVAVFMKDESRQIVLLALGHTSRELGADEEELLSIPFLGAKALTAADCREGVKIWTQVSSGGSVNINALDSSYGGNNRKIMTIQCATQLLQPKSQPLNLKK